MKKNYKELLHHIQAFVFDLDGVMTTGSFQVGPDGAPHRNLNSKDGYALQLAVKKGYPVGLISGGSCPGVESILRRLGVTDIYMQAGHKEDAWKDFLAVYEYRNLQEANILYMGDDIPDYPLIQKAGIGCAPQNAAAEIRSIADYVSHSPGGMGCVRDVIEQTLKLQDEWMREDDFQW